MTYTLYRHDVPQITKVSEFIKFRKLGVTFTTDIAVSEFLAFSAAGKTNRQRVVEAWQNYTGAEYTLEQLNEKAQQANTSPDPEIPVGAVFAIPYTMIKPGRETDFSTIVYRHDNLLGLYNSVLSDKMTNPSYVFKGENESEIGSINYFATGVKVWYWSRGLNKVLDLSRIISDLSFSESVSGGGSFSFKLPHIVFTDDGANQDKSPTNFFEFTNNNHSFASFSTFLNEQGRIQPSMFLQYFRQNDLVFINAAAYHQEFTEGLVADKMHLFGKDAKGNDVHWDMIGLVNTVSEQVIQTNQGTKYSLLIFGQDLYKLIDQDGEYTPILAYGDRSIAGFYNNINDTEREKNRAYNRINGQWITEYVSDVTIGEWASFVFQMMSNLQIAPDDLFDSVPPQERTKYLYQSFKEVKPVDELSDSPVEATQSSSRSFIPDGGKIEVEAAGIYKIVNLLIEDNGGGSALKLRRVTDATFTGGGGTMASYINKVLKPPFSELYGTTIGARYFFIVRKPPFDFQGHQNMLKYCDSLDRSTGEMWHIRASRVVSQPDLSFSTEVYSSYYMTINGQTNGSPTALPVAILPQITFPEIMEVFGNRPYYIDTNYIQWDGAATSAYNTGLNRAQEQCIEDLRFVIESSVYLPFTRQGSIVVQLNTRYKPGFFVRYLPTGEVFHIDEVSHNASSLNPTTTLKVSRGMVDQLYSGGKTDTLRWYFDLVNYGGVTGGAVPKINWYINQVIFKRLFGEQFNWGGNFVSDKIGGVFY